MYDVVSGYVWIGCKQHSFPRLLPLSLFIHYFRTNPFFLLLSSSSFFSSAAAPCMVTCAAPAAVRQENLCCTMSKSTTSSTSPPPPPRLINWWRATGTKLGNKRITSFLHPQTAFSRLLLMLEPNSKPPPLCLLGVARRRPQTLPLLFSSPASGLRLPWGYIFPLYMFGRCCKGMNEHIFTFPLSFPLIFHGPPKKP
jgi:hypothetical protein